ncbi:hypothetical protein PHISCL_04838 [Aspergillus sclerotialis]|uniref:Uncharacterized protein n=1 Tax=Aspergillus sclerotialis TaxID=2070753 RepID=A0A3A2ZHW6_9EURO|nr:hypothetical protein PHISCL_04838 [Aspergillus sclerotialis]
MFSRIFGRRKSYETDVIDGVEVGRPVIDSASVSGQSFSSSRSSKSNRRGSPEIFPDLIPVSHDTRKQIRRRPAPLQTGSLGFKEQTDSSSEGIWTPVRRSGAVRHQINPLTRRHQTVSNVDDDIIGSPNDGGGPRSASEPPNGRDDGYDIVGVDLSSFVPPPSAHHGPGPAIPVRRGAVRYSENPLTPRRDTYQGNGNDKRYQESSSRRLHSSASGPPPTGGSAGGSFPVRRGAVRHSGNPLTAGHNTLQGNGYTPDTPSRLKNNYDPDDLPADEIESLPRLLKSWIDTDKFLNGFVTTLVDASMPYTNIGRAIVRHLNIRDDNDCPLHDRLPAGMASLLSFRDHRPQSNHSQGVRTTQNPNLINPTVVCPQPRRNLPPNLANDLVMAWLNDPRSSDEETDPENCSPRNGDEYVVLRPVPEHKVQVVRPGLATGAQEASARESQSRGNSNVNATANIDGPESPFKGYRYEQPDFRYLVPSSNRQQALEALSECDGLKGRGPFL